MDNNERIQDLSRLIERYLGSNSFSSFVEELRKLLVENSRFNFWQDVTLAIDSVRINRQGDLTSQDISNLLELFSELYER